MADTTTLKINPVAELIKAHAIVHGEAETCKWRRFVECIERERARLADEANTYVEGW